MLLVCLEEQRNRLVEGVGKKCELSFVAFFTSQTQWQAMLHTLRLPQNSSF